MQNCTRLYTLQPYKFGQQAEKRAAGEGKVQNILTRTESRATGKALAAAEADAEQLAMQRMLRITDAS